MENHIEANFRAIQKILDKCVAHDYAKLKLMHYF